MTITLTTNSSLADGQHAKAQPIALDVTRSITNRAWLYRNQNDEHVRDIKRQHDLPDFLARILAGRGISAKDVSAFLNPTLKETLPDPSCLIDMDKAVDRLKNAILKNEKIAIFGDYDVDGATSTALLKRYFYALGIDVVVYIPDRLREGYGPNLNAILALKEKHNISLLITVDCGITAFDVMADVKNHGIDVIIFDHHKAEEKIPDVYAAVNPNRLDDKSGLGHLCAVGVSFMATVALNRALRQDNFFKNHNKNEPKLTTLLDLVALGTICDVVPLTTVNRSFVAQGLKIMALRGNKGINALLDIASFDEEPNCYAAGFVIGPRVNAGGRVGESYLGSQLLSSEDEKECTELAKKLNAYNIERKALENVMLDQAIEQVENTYHPDLPMIIAANDGWHAGVIGIAASRLKDKYQKPTLVIGYDDQGIGKGSGRSLPGVDLGAAIIAAKNQGLLVNGGGHAMAAGLTIAKDQFDHFQEFMHDEIRRQLGGETLKTELNIDAVLSVNALNLSLLDQLDQLAPYGQGNSEPRFALSHVKIIKPSVMGENHIRCFLQDSAGGSSIKAVMFRALDTPIGEFILKKSQNKTCHVAGYLKRNNWMGRQSIDFHIADIAEHH